MIYIILLLAIAVIGNFLIRRFLAKERLKDKAASTLQAEQAELMERSSVSLASQAMDVLKKWGKPAQSKIQMDAPLHRSVLELLDKYECVEPDKYFRPINRIFVKPFSENKNFMQIGVWSDDNEVLVKCDDSDGAIYLAAIEDGDHHHPFIVARTMNEFLVKAWNLNQDALQLKSGSQ